MDTHKFYKYNNIDNYNSHYINFSYHINFSLISYIIFDDRSDIIKLSHTVIRVLKGSRNNYIFLNVAVMEPE